MDGKTTKQNAIVDTVRSQGCIASLFKVTNIREYSIVDYGQRTRNHRLLYFAYYRTIRRSVHLKHDLARARLRVQRDRYIEVSRPKFQREYTRWQQRKFYSSLAILSKITK